MTRITALLSALAFLFVFPPVLLGKEEKAKEPPASRRYIEYAKEDLFADPPVVVGTGKIHLLEGDAEVRIEDGGVVLWVEPDLWRKFRSGKSEKTAGGLLGSTIREIYAEGMVTVRQGGVTIRAERLYANFVTHRALVIRGEFLARIGGAGPPIPLLVRAERIVQTAKDELRSDHATLSMNLYAVPHHEIVVNDLVLRRRGEDFTFSGDSLTLKYEGVPIFWVPWVSASTSLGTDPLRDVKVGTSSKFGVFGGLVFGLKLWPESEKAKLPWGDIEITPLYRWRRGRGVGGRFQYQEDTLSGKLESYYQRDREDVDRVLDAPVPNEDRGRIRFQHYQVLDPGYMGGRLHGTAELSWISDRGFLPEYMTNEFKEDKAQEDLAYLSWGGDDIAVSATGRWRANDFETLTEYRPRGRFDLFPTVVLGDVLGTGADVYLSGESEFAKVYRQLDEALGERGALTNRFLARGALTAPFGIGPIRVSPSAGGGTTVYGKGQEKNRLDGFASVRAAVDFWKVFPGVRSDLLDLSGLRHVVDVSAGYANRFGVSAASDEIVRQDSFDLLDEIEAVDLRLRNRLETKREGEIVTFVDLELRALFFPDGMAARSTPFDAREEFSQGISSLLVPEEETWRDIDRKGWGPVTGELRCQLRPGMFLAADARYDMETHAFETYSEGVRYDAGKGLSFLLSHRTIRGDSSILTTWADLVLTERWGARLVHQQNLANRNRLATGIYIRRRLPDFILEFQFRYNDKRNETSFNVTIEPTRVFDRRRERRRKEYLDFERMRWYR